MRFLFGGITLISLVGSITYFTPTVLWSDLTYFFRKDKVNYLKFSNRYRGRYMFFSACLGLLLFLLTFFITFKENIEFVFLVFFIYLAICRMSLEMQWYKMSQVNEREKE